MTEKLTCKICGRGGMLRLSRHLSEVHGIAVEEYLKVHPGSILEVLPTRIPTCGACRSPVLDRNPRAAHVLCSTCRKVPPLTEKTGVPCLICGELKRQLTVHLREAHGITREEYLTSHPGTLLEVAGSRTKSEKTREKMANSAKARWGRPGEREAASARGKITAPWRGKSLSETHKQAISKGGSGITHQLSEEGKKVRGDYGREALRVIRSHPGYNEKLSAAQKLRHERDPLVGLKNPETRKKSLASRLANGTLVPPNSGRGICGFRIGIPHYCRSTLEANFARVLIHLGVRYNYEPRVFKLASGTLYVPDFFLLDPILGYGIQEGWVELKGWRKEDGTVPSETKIRAFSVENNTSVTVIAESDDLWKKVSTEMSPSIPLWERPNKNLRTHPEVFGLPAFPPIARRTETSNL